jgi:7,8-dihydropterin-6-yl-methyl-4-(beta-D-ribofuranosyl)aminobenzene 5'-phosphate synthase
MSKKSLILCVGNTVYKRGMLAEHGLSIWLRDTEKNYLLDTGQGLTLLHNLEKLNLSIDALDGVFISHGHYDHAGGLEDILKINPGLRVYAHPAIFNKKYTLHQEEYREAGFKLQRKDIDNFKETKGVIKVSDNLWAITGIPFYNNFEKVNPDFVVDKGRGFEADLLEDELSLFLETPSGLIIISGCSHRGIINLLEQIKKVTGGKKVQAIIGGLHLVEANQERINKTINYFEKEAIEYFYPLHCSGETFVHEMQNKFGDRVKTLSVGETLEI